MKNQPSISTLEKRRREKLDKLGQCGSFVAGSLNRVERKDKKGGTTVYHLLTFKEEGKTRSVYVPKEMVREVRQWVRNHQKLKKALLQVSADSVAMIRRHVSERRAESAPSPRKRTG